jgi:hypothetical protein
MFRTFAGVSACFLASCVIAQEPPKPAEEMKHLEKMTGRWDCVIKMQGSESKGTADYRKALRGMWISGNFNGEIAGMPFQGRSFDGYDPLKKKYVGIWVDSMSPTPTIMEGTYDEGSKSMVMMGDGVGPDGRKTKMKGVTKMVDDNNMVFKMYVIADGGAENEMMTIEYKRSADQGKAVKKKPKKKADNPNPQF